MSVQIFSFNVFPSVWAMIGLYAATEAFAAAIAGFVFYYLSFHVLM